MEVAKVGVMDGHLYCLRCFDALNDEDFGHLHISREGELVCIDCQVAEGVY